MAIEIPLSAGRYVAVVDEQDADLALLRWHAKVARSGKNPLVYACRSVWHGDGYTQIRLHRLIYERAFGPIPEGREIDHITHGEFGGLDNRRGNLRIATHANNAMNGRRRANNTSTYKGVHFVKRLGRWQALIRIAGVRKHLGYFDDPALAGAAYDLAAVHAFGPFALTNGREGA